MERSGRTWQPLDGGSAGTFSTPPQPHPDWPWILTVGGKPGSTAVFSWNDLEKALRALNQEADVSSTQGGEHGLGLKLVWQIVKAHGGTVRFRQVGPHGLGICITFSAYNTR